MADNSTILYQAMTKAMKPELILVFQKLFQELLPEKVDGVSENAWDAEDWH